ncbi:MAG: Tryptophan-rich protein TspO [Candidatus Poseidoniaceae archaeon]|nr:MAG: Tryptophan-rich protein TspO [Candidatus Poseidoniaceae archaeon]
MTFDSNYEPFFQPPGWVVGPVWAVLYTTLAISFTCVLSKQDELQQFNLVVVFFLVQLALNLTWPSVFNSEHYLISLLMIVGMVVFSLGYIYLIHDAIPFASRLIWPYIAWVSFAGIINTAYLLDSIR